MKHSISIIIVIILIVIYIGGYSIESENSDAELDRDGIVLAPEFNKNIDEYIAESLPEGYVLMDYHYEIRGTALSTFHRDVTSSKHVYSTNYPVYTLIVYKYDGHHISYCPASHTQYPFALNRIRNVYGRKNATYLFDCDLLHAGGGGNSKDRHVIQYKICHASDVDKLGHLQGIHVVKNGDVDTPYLSRMSSYFFQLPINYVFTPFLIQKYPENTFMGSLQSIVSINFYNNV